MYTIVANHVTAGTISNDGSLGSESRRSHMNTVIKQGLQRLDESKTTYTIAGHEFDPLDQIAIAAKVVLWAKEWIGSAVEASPAASIAWAGVCLFLPLLTNPSTAAAASSSGFTNVTARMRYYVELEPMVQRLGQNPGVSSGLMSETNSHIVDLYQHILDFQISCVLRLYQSRAKTYVKDMVPLHDWTHAESDIDTLEQIVRKDLGQINEFATREQLEDSKHKLADLDETSRKSLGTLHELLSIGAQQLAVSKETLAFQQATALKMLSDEQKECLQLFHLTSSEKDITYQWYKDRIEDRVGDTCLWLTEHPHFQEWLERESGPLLISADPGCGKSVLAKYLINHELPRRQSATICYFFFKDKDQVTACQALCALLHQLFTQRPSLIKHAMAPFDNKGQGLINSKTSLWSIFANAIRDTDDTLDPVIIVLDALDECDDAEFEFLIRNLKQQYGDNNNASQAKLKLLMTSRPYTQIVSEFRDMLSTFPNIRIPGEENSDRVRDEIDIVIKHRVKQLDSLKSDIKQFLLERLRAVENRTYLWIYLVFDYLQDYLRKGLKKTKKGIEKAIETMPSSVNEAYEQILEKSPDPDLAKKVLCIILAAQRPLTVREMNFAVNLDESIHLFSDLDLDDEEDFETSLRSCCGLFVSIYQDKVYFLHQTAREFLLAEQISAPVKSANAHWHRSITICHAHAVLAQMCLYYLDIFNHDTSISVDECSDAIDELQLYPEETDSDIGSDTGSYSGSNSGSERSKASEQHDYAAESEKEVRDRDMAHLYFLGYSATYWALHFRRAEIADDDMLHILVLAICERYSASRSIWSKVFVERATSIPIDELQLYGLFAASHLRLFHTAQLLIDDGADVNELNVGMTPLLLAAMNGDEAVARLLLQHGADANKGDCDGTKLPLLEASLGGHEAVVRLLLAHGADIAAHGHAALLYAAWYGQEAVARLLLENGVLVDDPSDNGTTPLIGAARCGYDAVLQLLLRNGASVHARDEVQSTALMEAAASGHDTTVRLLVDNGACVEDKDEEGVTPLINACRDGNGILVHYLLEAGAGINSQTEDGYTPLYYALERRHEHVERILLENGARVDLRIKDGQPLLNYAAMECYPASPFAKLLLKYGADVHARDDNGRTALWEAVAAGDTDLVQLLLDHGSDPCVADNKGNTPRDIALHREYTDMVEMMGKATATS